MYYYRVVVIGSPLGEFSYHYEEKISDGTKVKVLFNSKERDGVVLSSCEKPLFQTNNILEITTLRYSPNQILLAKFIATYYICSVGEGLSLMMAFENARVDEILNQVQNDGGIQNDGEVEHNIQTVIPGLTRNLADSKIILSPKQEKALTFLKQHKTSLLFGDTGSGKTEIYMKLFEQMMQEGKRSIFLMPEISLTPQMGLRLKEHFGDAVVMWHSKLTPKQKREAEVKIQDGSAYVIAGARSALFSAVQNLGLIVVDEEHDDSYKSSSRPRYSARDIAIYMGKLYDVPVVLGSATPSLSSFVKFPYTRLKGGHFKSQRGFTYERSREKLSPLIISALAQTLKAKEQSIVFLPTRANFKYLVCGDCGHTLKCAFCSIGMSIHQKSRALKCHYCNFTQAIPQICSECQSPNLLSARLGTAEAVQELSEEFKEAKVEQFDRDVITTATKLKKALKRFNDKETDILVGTQMLSKGHDYHGVTLAVVLGMDNMLNMSDYRAREKALSSLIQVAGRSGRKSDAKVLVQSFNEEFFSTYVNDYESFLQEEKEYRKELYPPYKKLCRILFAHKNGAKAQEAMREMQERLKAFSHVEIVGAKKCAIERVANKYRFEILLRSDKSTSLIGAINATKNALAEVDMDPIEFS